MCGRFVLDHSPVEIQEAFSLRSIPDLRPRYNIAPSQHVAIVRKRSNNQNELVQLKWGLIPYWAKDRSIGAKLINARSETVSEKPSFKNAFRFRRCVIPATGFYEWAKKNDKKIPHYFYCENKLLMLFAGLWDYWTSRDGSILESCAILTTEANSLIKPFHHRMPVILEQDSVERWVECDSFDETALMDLLRPFPSKLMREHIVSQGVNSPKLDSPECLLPAGV